MFRKLLPLAAVAAFACEKPGVAPGLDLGCDGGACSAPGVIQGSLVYSGTARGDAILFLFDTQALPPPDGSGTSAVAVARIPSATLFANAAAGSIGPFSAPFAFTQVPTQLQAGGQPRAYQIRAFLDVTREFNPFFDFTQQPRAGAPAGGHGELVNGVPKLAAIPVAAGQVVADVNVALTQTLPYDPPSFVLAGGSQVIDVSIDQPVKLRLQTVQLSSTHASFANAHFGLELDLDAQGNRQSTAGDGLDDVFPRVFLRQMKKLDGTAVADAAIVPCRAIAVPVLPALLALAPGAAPIARDALDVFALPLSFKSSELAVKTVAQATAQAIPAGVYQVIVVERSGQVWTLPNQLGDPSLGADYYSASQAQTVTFDSLMAPANSVRGNVVYHGDPSIKSGNIIVQAYLATPYAPPPPLGAALPVRVQLIRSQDVTRTPDGVTAPYRIDGLPAGNYFVQALADVDGNFSSLNLLQTPTKGDLIGAVVDLATLKPAVVAVSGDTAGQDVAVSPQQVPFDPPAFEFDAAAATMGADSVAPIRFAVRAKPLAFPIAAGNAATTAFTVSLVRDASGKTVDADGDGLPDVWPRAFLVRLDPADLSGLSQARSTDGTQTVTQVIPAAVDPTPFLPALLADGAPVTLLASKVTIIARPALLDATNPAAAPVRQSHLVPGKYKLVLINQTGQIWQVPNEAGPAALDPSVVCAAAASSCPPGTVQTQSQSNAFTVTVPASLNPGSISGTLHVSGSFAGAYVFAYDAANPPPPQGTGTPVSGDFHAAAEFSGGAVAYALPNLPTTKNYLVTAVVDTRGDFALSPQLFAAAPGEGTLVGVHAGVVSLSATPQMTGIDVTAALALPPRPSFVLRSAGADVMADVTTLFPDALMPQRISLHASGFVTSKVAWQGDTHAPAFLVQYQGCDASGAPLDGSGNLPVDADDFDNVPDLFPKVLVVRLSDADPTGLTPDPNTTVIPAAVDPTRFSLGACAAHNVVAATDLSVILSPVAVHFVAGQPVAGPIPPGRYGVVVVQSTGQVWRIPNELQPALLDPHSAAAVSLASQGVAISVGAQVPAATTGSISGAVSLAGYTPATVGNLVVAAYDSAKPPPPLGLGRPLAVQVIPAPFVAAFAGGAVGYQLANLTVSKTYYVAALMDTAEELSPLFSFMSTPPLGAQIGFFGGPVPSPIAVSGAMTGKDITIAPAKVPFDRPAFAFDAASPTTLSVSSGAPVVIKIDAGTPANLPYGVSAATPMFHPTPARCGTSGKQIQDPSQSCTPGFPYQDMNTLCGATGHPWVSTQVYAAPLGGAGPVPYVITNACQFCAALTGSVDCTTGAPGSGTMAVSSISAAVTAAALDPDTHLPLGAPLPAGAYAITAVEPTGQSWTIPNELGAAQSAFFTFTTP